LGIRKLSFPDPLGRNISILMPPRLSNARSLGLAWQVEKAKDSDHGFLVSAHVCMMSYWAHAFSSSQRGKMLIIVDEGKSVELLNFSRHKAKAVTVDDAIPQ